MRKLFDVQRKHADNLIDVLQDQGAALDGSITGGGKTLVAAQIAAESERPTLIVCPKSATPMWVAEMTARKSPAIGVINYEMLRTGGTRWGEWDCDYKGIWKWKLPEDAFIIWDECQRAQGMNTQNARIMWSAKPFYNLCLSATAAEDPTEMKALGYLLNLHDLKGFWCWTKMHGCTNGFYGGLQFTGDPEDIDRLHNIVYPKHGSRLTYSDMAPYFKATEIITTPLDFGDELKKIYATMSRELDILEERMDADHGAEALTIRLRARQKAELLKVPEIVYRVYDLLKEGLSVAIFVNFDATAEAIREKLETASSKKAGISCGMITGRHVKERQKYINLFQSDQLRVMICNVQAGGISVSLHDTHGKHPRVSLISPSDNAKDVLQCLGRIHRAGGETPTRQFVLFAADTVEEEVEANCRSKIDRIGIFNEGMS